jgi:hypothetical protein
VSAPGSHVSAQLRMAPHGSAWFRVAPHMGSVSNPLEDYFCAICKDCPGACSDCHTMLRRMQPAAEDEPEHSAKKESKAAQPSMQRQKTFIIEHASMLNKETKVAILSVVMMEVGEIAVMQRLKGAGTSTDEVDIDLDACSSAEREGLLIGPDVINQIYNIVKARIDSLSQPAGTDPTPQRRLAGSAAVPAAHGKAPRAKTSSRPKQKEAKGHAT